MCMLGMYSLITNNYHTVVVVVCHDQVRCQIIQSP